MPMYEPMSLTFPHDYFRGNMTSDGEWLRWMGQHAIAAADRAATRIEQEGFVKRIKKMLDSAVCRHFLKNCKTAGGYYAKANSMNDIKELFSLDMEGEHDNVLFGIMEMGAVAGWRDSIANEVLKAERCTVLEPPRDATARTTFVKRFQSAVIAAVRRSVNEASRKTHGRAITDRRENRAEEDRATPMKRRGTLGSARRVQLTEEVEACSELASFTDRCGTDSQSTPVAACLTPARTFRAQASPRTGASRGAQPRGGSTVKAGRGISRLGVSPLFGKQQGTP